MPFVLDGKKFQCTNLIWRELFINVKSCSDIHNADGYTFQLSWKTKYEMDVSHMFDPKSFQILIFAANSENVSAYLKVKPTRHGQNNAGQPFFYRVKFKEKEIECLECPIVCKQFDPLINLSISEGNVFLIKRENKIHFYNGKWKMYDCDFADDQKLSEAWN